MVEVTAVTRKADARSVTMTDVARRAGVSQTTVSLVMNNVPAANIPAETRQRVVEAIQELGYRPNAAARLMRTSRSLTIGMIADEILTTPFAGLMIKGAQDAAWAAGKLVLLVNTDKHEDIERAAIELMLGRQVEGLIYAAMYHQAVNPPATVREVPTVLLDCYCEDRSLPSVVPDEVGGGREATEVLLRKGHRRIGLVQDVEPIPAAAGRFEGYRQALAAFGVPYDPDLVRMERASSQGGYACARELLQMPNRPSALFCFNDRMAMGAYDAIRQLGLAIPGDVAVVGFDNQEVIAAHLYPPLSTMELPHYRMGEWAVQHLLESAGVSPAPVQHILACPYIERQSV